MPNFEMGRYKVQDSHNRNEEIQGLSWMLDADNIVMLEWTWPKEPCFKMALIFEADTPEDTLEMLLQNKDAVVITKSMGEYYKKPIKASGKRFKVFPARFGEGSEIIVIDQKSNNTTDYLLKKTRVEYSILYQKIRFSNYQKVMIHAESNEALMPGSVFYEKYDGNRFLCCYPLEGSSGDIFFYMKKHETIKIKAAERYKDILDIRIKCNSSAIHS